MIAKMCYFQVFDELGDLPLYCSSQQKCSPITEFKINQKVTSSKAKVKSSYTHTKSQSVKF